MLNIDQIKQYIDQTSPETRVYIGVDSERVMVNCVPYAVYTTAVVVHIDGNNGCKLFGGVDRERDYGPPDKPSNRLMNEAYKVSDLYLKLAEVIQDREIQVHLDLNPNDQHLSSAVIAQAVGYVRGVCNVIPKVKPVAFAATTAADRYRSLKTANE